MLFREDFDLNLVQRYSEPPVADGFKQTMVDQDAVFRRQARELHRLCGVQQPQMKGFSYKDIDMYDSFESSGTQSFPRSLDTETNGFSIPRVDPIQCMRQEVFKQRKDPCRPVQKRPLDLQSPMNRYSYRGNESIQSRENTWIHLKGNTGQRELYSFGQIQNPVELELSLGVGSGNKIENGRNRTKPLFQTITEHAASFSHAAAPAPAPSFAVVHNVEASIFPDQSVPKYVKNDQSLGTTESATLVSSADKVSSSHADMFDLNEVPADDTDDLNDTSTANTHITCEKSEVQNQENVDVSTGSTDLSSNGESKSSSEDAAEAESAIQAAAESLVQISVTSPAFNQEHSQEKTQHSCDSYELFVLDIAESKADYDCVSSRPLIEVKNDTENKNCTVSRLRRGRRRMKDFQKDILPGLTSLARHEIREDICTIEGVLRSREYRKFKASMGESWSAPRSKLGKNRRK